MRYAAYVFISAVAAACAGAQEQPAAETPLIRATTRAVVLDVTVTDAHGVPIKGLNRDDFVVTEDGVRQRIASFETSAMEQQQGSEPPSQTVIILDELNTRFVDIAYARYSLEKYLKRNSAELDRPAQLLALTDHGLDLVHDYTRNGSDLLQSLERLPARLPFRLGVSGGSGLSDRLNISLGALKQVARANAYSGKRTTVIWVSPGFPVITPFNLDPVQRQELLNVLRNLSDELLRWRVTVYSIDPRGVFNNGENRAADAFLGSLEANSTAFGDLALERLAVETGGRAFYGRNDVNNLVATSIVQSNMFYTLSYYPSNTNEDGTFRKIHVAIEKPGLTARTRDGYYAVAESPLTPKDVTLSVKQALVNPLVYKGVAVSIANAAANSNLGSAASVAIDGNALDWEPTAEGKMRFHVMVGVADFTGHDVAYSHIAAFDGEMAAAKFQTGVSKRVMLTVNVPVERKSSVLRIVVCDLKNGRLGTAEAAW